MCTKMCTIKKLQERSERTHPNQPQGWNNRTTLSPVVKLVKTISPGESIHVLPNIKLLTLVGGGTSSRITPSFFSFKRVLQPKDGKTISNNSTVIVSRATLLMDTETFQLTFLPMHRKKNGYQLRPSKVLWSNKLDKIILYPYEAN